jgi:hypothetical protein
MIYVHFGLRGPLGIKLYIMNELLHKYLKIKIRVDTFVFFFQLIYRQIWSLEPTRYIFVDGTAAKKGSSDRLFGVYDCITDTFVKFRTMVNIYNYDFSLFDNNQVRLTAF